MPVPCNLMELQVESCTQPPFDPPPAFLEHPPVCTLHTIPLWPQQAPPVVSPTAIPLRVQTCKEFACTRRGIFRPLSWGSVGRFMSHLDSGYFVATNAAGGGCSSHSGMVAKVLLVGLLRSG